MILNVEDYPCNCWARFPYNPSVFFYLNWEHSKIPQVDPEKFQDAKATFPYKCKEGKGGAVVE